MISSWQAAAICYIQGRRNCRGRWAIALPPPDFRGLVTPKPKGGQIMPISSLHSDVGSYLKLSGQVVMLGA